MNGARNGEIVERPGKKFPSASADHPLEYFFIRCNLLDPLESDSLPLCSSRCDDYTVPPHDEDKNGRYMQRHQANTNWNDYTSAGALSIYIVCKNKDLKTVISKY